MFFRIAPRRQGDVTYRYLQLVESYREGGKNRQRVLYSLGNVDSLRSDGQLGRLVASLERAAGLEPRASVTLQTERVLEYGGSRLAQALWEQFGLTELLRELLAGRRCRFDVIAAVAGMVFNRLLAPKSELALFAWRDRIWWPAFAQAPLELAHFYAALDVLLSVKEPLEEALFARLKDLFNLEVDLVFYDLTSTYFEGDGPPLAAYGYSRDKRPDRRQVLVALACDRHGFPIAHEVLAGQRADVTTVKAMVAALSARFRLRRVIFVADRGMVSAENLEALTKAGYEYVVGMRRNRVPEVLSRAPEDLAHYEPGPHRVRLYATAGETPGTRYLCCYSEARAEEERQIRQARIRRGEQALAKLAAQVAAGRLKRPEKIAVRVATALRQAHATSYFTCAIEEAKLSFARNEARIAEEERLAGRYFLLTNAEALTPSETVEAYFTLQEVERAFREMKDFLKLRPIYHWTDRRVRAHIFVCVLACLLERSLTHQLRAAGLELSARTALDWASRIHAVENCFGEATIWTVSRPPPVASQVPNAVGLPTLPTVLQGPDLPGPNSDEPAL